MPQLCDRVVQRTAANGWIGAWAAAVLGARLVQMWARELICKYHTPPAAIGWRQNDQSFPHWWGQICTLWLALADVGENMGPLRYVRGSHQWGMRDAARFFFETELDEQRRVIGTPPGRSWLEEVAAPLPGGAASLLHRLTLHASGPNRGSLPRIGLAIHLRTERASLVKATPPPFHRPDLSDPYACPVLAGRPARGAATEVTA